MLFCSYSDVTVVIVVEPVLVKTNTKSLCRHATKTAFMQGFHLDAHIIYQSTLFLSMRGHFAAAPTNTGALECAKLFRHHVVRLHGLPRDIVSDQDPRWKGKFWTELCRLCDIKQKMSTPYHPQTDGQTEQGQ